VYHCPYSRSCLLLAIAYARVLWPDECAVFLPLGGGLEVVEAPY
jgi:hypothetical protein